MKGRPILGAVSGLFFGLFLALALFLWGIWPLDRLTVFGLPILFLIVGIAGAAWAPIGKAPTGN
jgi:hypothetical protein